MLSAMCEVCESQMSAGVEWEIGIECELRIALLKQYAKFLIYSKIPAMNLGIKLNLEKGSTF